MNYLRSLVYFGLITSLAAPICSFAADELQVATGRLNWANASTPQDAASYLNRGILNLGAGDGAAAEKAAMPVLSLSACTQQQKMTAALIAYFANTSQNRGSDAANVLSQTAQSTDRSLWPYPIIAFLRREQGEHQLLDSANDPEKRAQARAFIALQQLSANMEGAARQNLQWLLSNTRNDDVYHDFAILRLNARPAAASSQAVIPDNVSARSLITRSAEDELEYAKPVRVPNFRARLNSLAEHIDFAFSKGWLTTAQVGLFKDQHSQISAKEASARRPNGSFDPEDSREIEKTIGNLSNEINKQISLASRKPNADPKPSEEPKGGKTPATTTAKPKN